MQINGIKSEMCELTLSINPGLLLLNRDAPLMDEQNNKSLRLVWHHSRIFIALKIRVAYLIAGASSTMYELSG